MSWGGLSLLQGYSLYGVGGLGPGIPGGQNGGGVSPNVSLLS